MYNIPDFILRGLRFLLRLRNLILRRIFYNYYSPYDFITLYKPNLNIKVIAKDYAVHNHFPKYSFLMPVLNEVQNIEIVLNSVLAQTILPDELIIVDGGSTDGTIDIIKKYQDKLNIILIASKLKNIGHQRNLALDSAKNNMVINIDAGTKLDHNFAANLLGPFIEFPDLDLVCGIHHPTIIYKWSNCFSPKEHFKHSAKPYGNSVAYKKDLAIKCGKYGEFMTRAGEDSLFFYNYQKFSQNWLFNKNAFILWDHPDSYESAKNKMKSYILGNFEVGFWPYYYYEYIFYPLAREILDYYVFKANCQEFLLKQAQVEINGRQINGIYFIFSKYRIDEPESAKSRDYIFELIKNNNKVFFIDYSEYDKKKIHKISKTYIDTDITLLEIIPYKFFDIQAFRARYGDFFDKSLFIANSSDIQIKDDLDKIKTNMQNIKVMYDVVQ